MTTTGVDRIAGLSGSVAIKAPCQFTTTGPITLSGLGVQANGTWLSTLTQDDSNPVRVLVKNQANPIDNGIFNPGAGTWQRARDFNGSRDAVQGTLVHVYQDGISVFFELATASPVIGTSSLEFDEFRNNSDGQIVVIADLDDAVETTQQEVNRRRYSISDFLSDEQRSDVKARTRMIDTTQAWQNAWDSGEFIEGIDGDFRVDGTVSSFVVPRFIGTGIEGTRIFCYALSGRCFEFLNAGGSFDEGGVWTGMSFNAFTNHFTGTGAQTAFVLSYTPTSESNYSVQADGTTLTYGVHYTRSGNTLNFVVAPALGVRIYVPYGTADMLRLNGLVYNTSKVGDLLFRGHGGIGADFNDCLTLKPYRLRSQGGFGIGLVQRKGNHFMFIQPSVESCGAAHGILCDNDGAAIGENFGGGIVDAHVEEGVGNAITVKGKFGFGVWSANEWVQVSSGPVAAASAAIELDTCQNCSVRGLLNTGGTATNLIAVKITGSIKCDIDIQTYGFASNKDIVCNAAGNRNRVTGFREASQGALEKTDSSTIKNYYVNYAGSGGEYGKEESYNYFKLSDASGNLLQDVRLLGNIQPKQPSVLARLSAQQVDVTGDATLYAVVPDVEIMDKGSNFASGAYTGPATSASTTCSITAVAELNGLLAGHTTQEIFIITSNRTYNCIETMSSNPFTTRTMQLHVNAADVDAGDTVSMSIRVSGATKVVDVNGGGGMRTFLAVHLDS